MEWTIGIIEKNYEKVDFNELSNNKKFRANENLIKYFSTKLKKKELNSYQFSNAIHDKWSINYIEENINRIDWRGLCMNKSVPWGFDLINKFSEQIEWNNLINNPSVVWTPKLFNKFHTKGQFHTDLYRDSFGIDTFINHELFELLIPTFERVPTWDGLSSNQNLKWNKRFIEKYKHKWNWKLLSYNPSIKWTKELIDKYKQHIDFFQLSGNKSIHWNIDLIEEFGDKILWGTIEKRDDRMGTITKFNGLDNSPNLNLTNFFLDKHVEKWNWKYLGRNLNIEWTKSFFTKHKSNLN
jgi:hypothetical protein